MQGHQAGPEGWLSYVVPAIVIALVLFLRLRRVNKARPLKIGRLWIVPAIYAVLVALLLVAQRPSAAGWIAGAIGLALGAALGWQRGRTIRIRIDRETGELNQQASIAGLLFIVALIAVKSAARAGENAFHLDVAVSTDALLGFALGLFTLMRIEMYLRAKRLIGSSRDADATPIL